MVPKSGGDCDAVVRGNRSDTGRGGVLPCEAITCCVATYHLIFRLDPTSCDPIREYEFIDGPSAETQCYLLGRTCVEICGSWPGAAENRPLNDPQNDASLAAASISQVPAMDAIEVTTPSGDRPGATLRILDAEGRSLISVDQTESNGRFTFVVPVRELAAGYYRCEVVAGEELIASVNYTKSR